MLNSKPIKSFRKIAHKDCWSWCVKDNFQQPLLKGLNDCNPPDVIDSLQNVKFVILYEVCPKSLCSGPSMWEDGISKHLIFTHVFIDALRTRL